MSELTPITRIENYLDAIVNSGTPPLEDITRIETFLQAIYDNQVCALTPITRIEMFLGKISGQDIVLPEPITRIELYLAAIAGEDVELPENPITRIEMYLAEWADSGDWTTISGAIVEFIATRAHKLKSCVVTLEPKQDLSHGDPSPTNICPISGWTGCEVVRTGVNIANISQANEAYKGGAAFYTLTYGENSVTMETSTVGSLHVVWQLFRVTADMVGTTLYFSRDVTGGYCSIVKADVKDGTWSNSGTTASQGGSYTLTNDDVGRNYGIRFSNTTGQNQTASNIVVSIDSATDYEPYNGNSYQISFPDSAGTVYGGTLTVNEDGSGSVAVTWVNEDPSTLSFTLKNNTSNRQAWIAMLDGLKPVTDGNTPPYAISSEFKPISYGATWLPYCVAPNYEIASGYSNLVFCFPSGSYETETEVQTALSGVQLVYELATPVTFSLTAEQIIALKGYNAMWSDAGDIEVTVHGTPVEVETLQALNMLLGGAYRNNQTADDVSDEEALEIILGGENR